MTAKGQPPSCHSFDESAIVDRSQASEAWRQVALRVALNKFPAMRTIFQAPHANRAEVFSTHAFCPAAERWRSGEPIRKRPLHFAPEPPLKDLQFRAIRKAVDFRTLPCQY